MGGWRGRALTPERLDALCGRDPAVRAEVQSLLRHAGADDLFLDPSELHGSRAEALAREAALEEWGGSAVGQRVGDFVLIGQLGAGGMGIVYTAEQRRPRRTVALKLIRRAVATPAVVARFEREAELLGRLSHPGIAQIYAAGLADVEPAGAGGGRGDCSPSRTSRWNGSTARRSTGTSATAAESRKRWSR